MGKSNRSFTILIIALLIMFVAAIFYVTADTRKIIPFEIKPDKVLSDVLNENNRISPIKVAKFIINNDSSVILVDIRSQFKYLKGHLPNAINIYKADVLDKENIGFFRSLKQKNKRAILYGDNVIEANTPYMILTQVGVEGIVLMESGYSFFEDTDMKLISEMGVLDTDSEIAAMDFAKLINTAKVKADKITKEEELKKAEAKRVKVYTKKNNAIVKKKTIVTKKKQTPKATKPKQEEEEEDEGC